MGESGLFLRYIRFPLSYIRGGQDELYFFPTSYISDDRH